MYLGYNGFPKGVKDSEERWASSLKHFFLVHAEENAINKALMAEGRMLGECILICTMLPCSGCLRKCASVELRNIYYVDQHADMLATEDQRLRKQLIEEAGLTLTRIDS